MSNILTQEEIDALLAASNLAEEGALAAPQSATANNSSSQQESPVVKRGARTSKRISLYDFRRPNKFSKDHMRHIQMIHDNFSRIYKPTLTFQLRTNAHLRLIYIEQHSYEEFLDLANNQTIYAILSFLKGRAILGIDIQTILVIIERLLGGEGSANLNRRELTDIEMSLFQRMLERIIASLTEAWGSILTSTPKVELIENNPQVIQIVSPNEIVIKLVIEIAIGEEYTGNITLCYPYVSLAPIIDDLGSYQWITSEIEKTFTQEDEAFIKRRIEKTKVPIIFELGKTTITLRDLLNLQIGDIIKLDKRATDNLPLKIGGKIKFLGQCGIIGKNLAGKIEEAIYPDSDDSYINRILDKENNRFLKEPD
ncbi:MAG: flagellar motor switch protein FliM [Candidatus Margulisiibacteriota bacterium]|nr:MAG: flagellar motor switch protein FliM [Candidatus Margulisbacteria bacterium GWD2_39_127]OGI02115.1 MAG: flagellar motor switch protein FliM [Candidatus Margulisbacteria bacterium GWF2_38_17]OGI10492.1 MAG: flagellar motor switch protein FliM [Candidatus Margulisbacteria bacterium GWE2_39_32]PZM79962.1 MAG: flagellar motor switch protein FliM [Candidatus Margulisiibacteriota bacterium]HAR62426.1 flagellar motor switch protein FliM [Candidatus Margulisiibacteriota bacterium]